MKTPGRERNDYTVDQQTPTEWKSQMCDPPTNQPT